MFADFQSIAIALVWFSLGTLFYVYFGYPLLLAAVATFVHRPRASLGHFPELTMLIAAYNEEGGIGKKIEQTLSLSYPPEKLKILVLSDGSTDRTDQIVQSFDDPRIRLLRTPQRRGKTSAQNLGASVADGEVLVFSDATTVYHPMALQYLACNFLDPKVGAVSGRYQYFDTEGNSPTGSGMITFWKYENFIKLLQSRIQTITGCCGCIYAVRREAYTALKEDIISDLVQPLWAIEKGYRVVFEDRALAYEETTKSSAEEFSMRVRVVTRGMRGILSVRQLLNPAKNPWVSFQLLSHKVLRWLVPLFMLLLFTSGLALIDLPGYRTLGMLQAVFYGFVLFTLLVPVHKACKVLGMPLYFCIVNAAALYSLIEILRGRKYVVWETVRN